MNVKLVKCKDYDEMSRKAAAIFAAQITLKPDSLLGFATGSTPCGLYAQLSKWCQAGDISFKKIRTVNLDEYVGLPVEHYESYRSFMNRNLFNNVDIDPGRGYRQGVRRIRGLH